MRSELDTASAIGVDDRRQLLHEAAGTLAVAITGWMVINTYTYSLVTAIPLIQSDAWLFLDTFLGRFIEHGFSFVDLFAQANPGDTNQPLQKLFLFMHTRFFGMDFRLDGLFGTIAGIVLVLVLARAAIGAGPVRWGARELWLLTALALTQLSLNSTNIYTWPLATLWFVPLLIAACFMWFVFTHPQARFGMLLASLLLGMLLDEVALPVFGSVCAALLLAHRSREPGQLGNATSFGLAGIATSRMLYWFASTFVEQRVAQANGRSYEVLLDPQIWKAAFLPLADSVVHSENVGRLLGVHAETFAGVVGGILLLAHLWFWWKVVVAPRHAECAYRLTTLLAAAIMVLFYGLVFGIAIQRVPEFGFDYLHQSRYVMFYQLNLAALVLMVYREWRYPLPALHRGPAAGATMISAIVLFAALQWCLSTLAWKHAKYLSAYVENVALTMGKLARDPTANIECADIMTVCQFPAQKRRELMGRLQRYQLNVFSPAFQAFHRLHPNLPVGTVEAVPARQAGE